MERLVMLVAEYMRLGLSMYATLERACEKILELEDLIRELQLRVKMDSDSIEVSERCLRVNIEEMTRLRAKIKYLTDEQNLKVAEVWRKQCAVLSKRLDDSASYQSKLCMEYAQLQRKLKIAESCLGAAGEIETLAQVKSN